MSIERESSPESNEEHSPKASLLQFEDTEGRVRKLIASQDVVELLRLSVRNMNRSGGMGGIDMRKMRDQKNVPEGFVRFKLITVYPFPLDFLSDEMSTAVSAWERLHSEEQTREKAVESVSQYLQPTKMVVRYGQFIKEHKDEIDKVIFPNLFKTN